MLGAVGAQTCALCAHDQCRANIAAKRARQAVARSSIQPDAPKPAFGQLVERARQIDDAQPRHGDGFVAAGRRRGRNEDRAAVDPDGAQLAAIVGEFSGWMLAELHANASKGPPRSWRGDAVEGPRWALHETVTHLEKLRRAVEAGDRAKIREHAADVGCCALFVADCARVLETPLPRVVEPRGGGVQYGGGSE